MSEFHRVLSVALLCKMPMEFFKKRFQSLPMQFLSARSCAYLSSRFLHRKAPGIWWESILAATRVGLHIVPFILEYENAQKYFVQKINTSSDYLGIEAIIQSGTPEVYQVSLVEKESRRKVFYTNSEARAKFLTASGKVARVVQIAYK